MFLGPILAHSGRIVGSSVARARRPLTLAAVLLMGFGVALAVAPGTQAASSTVVLSNSNSGRTADNPLAQSFTTGSASATLTEVRMRVMWGMLDSMSVQIWTNNEEGAEPGDRHCDMGDGGTFNNPSSGTKSFDGTTCSLEAATTYWVVVNHYYGTSVSPPSARQPANRDHRRNYGLGTGSASSFGWTFGEARYWSDNQWKPNPGITPWLQLVTSTSLEVVPPPPPVAAPPADTRSAACQARQRAAEKAFPGWTVIVHCD